MTTQTLQDIIGKEPFHWRGDKDGLEEFNAAFIGLHGDDTNLTPTEMNEFKNFLATMYFPPNPHRNLDNSLPATLPLPGVPASGRFALAEGAQLPPGRPNEGLLSYRTHGLDGRGQLGVGIDCVTCHSLPTGMGADVVGANLTGSNGTPFTLRFSVDFLPIHKGPNGEAHLFMTSLDGSTNRAIKVPQLRNQLEKTGFDMTKTENLAGFGVLHDGSVDTLSRFVSEPVFFPANDQEVADLVSFMMCFSGSDLPVGGNSGFLDFSTLVGIITKIDIHPRGPDGRDSHAATGYDFTVGSGAPVPTLMGQDGLSLLIREARESGATGARGIDLVAAGEVGGVERAWYYDRTLGSFVSDRDDDEPTSVTTLLEFATTNAPITFMATQRGGGRRLSIDKDGDAFGNQTEILSCTDPENVNSRPDLGSPTLAISPPQIAFGDQHIDAGAYYPQDVTVLNTGAGQLTFKGARAVIVGPDADDFAIITGTPVNPVAGNGGMRTISVTFDPTTTGAKTATLLVITSRCDAPVTQIPLTGTGVDGVGPTPSPSLTPSPSPSPSASPSPTPLAPPGPVIHDLGDFIVGDLEDGAASNLFAFPDAIPLDERVTDADTPVDQIVWSFAATNSNITLNGVGPVIGLPLAAHINPSESMRIDSNDVDPAQRDFNARTVTIRNKELSPNTGPRVEPGVGGIVTSQTQTLTLVASDRTTTDQKRMIVYTSNNRPDEWLNEFDFVKEVIPAVNGAGGWLGALFQGEGSVTTSGGLCMNAPAAGANIIGWVSPERYVALIDQTVYRLRMSMTTTQTLADRIPLWDMAYDNYNASGYGSSYGGEEWLLDVAGGSQGIGRASGRSEFVFYAAPNAMLAQQWRGLVDQTSSAFTPAADASNDMRFVLRALDFGETIAAELDSGVVCMKRLRVDSIPSASLPVAASLYAPAISSTTHAAQTLGEAAENAGVATIDDAAHTASYQLLDGSGAGARKTLVPYNQTLAEGANPNERLYPVVWQTDEVYRATIELRSGVAGAAEGTDPVDAVFLAMDSALSELGAIHYTSRGAPGNMLRASSPRLAATTGGAAQPYVMFLHANTQSADTLIPDSGRLRALAYFMNNAQIGPEGAGANPFVVESLTIDRINPPAN